MSCVTPRRTLSLTSIISLIAIACESLLLRYTSCGSHCFPALLTTVAGNYRVIYFSQMDNRHLLARHFPCACGGGKERHLCPCGDLLTRWIRSDSRLLSTHYYELPDKRVLFSEPFHEYSQFVRLVFLWCPLEHFSPEIR